MNAYYEVQLSNGADATICHGEASKHTHTMGYVTCLSRGT